MKGLMKKTAAVTAAALISVSSVLSASAFGSVTEAPTPTDKNDAALYWATKTATGWTDAPGVPLVMDDKLVFTAAKKLKALDKVTGEVLSIEGTMAAATSYGITAPVLADDKIIVSLGGGIIQAFDAETFESLWIYKDELGGQSNSEILYADGYVYTGFWNSETKDANFVCVPVEDTDTESTDEAQQAAWTYTTAGGFYWAGAYDAGDYIVVGTDDGTSAGDSEGSRIVAFDKAASIENGEAAVVSESTDVKGDLRSAVSYDEETGYYFITSKAKEVYRFKLDAEGNITDLSSLELAGMSTSTPIAANGRLYVGVSGTAQFSEYSGHHIAVIDAESFEIVYTLQTNGYCQSSALISDADGENYVYFTANYTPGKVYVFHDNSSMTEPEKTETVNYKGNDIECCPTLLTPVGAQSQYCLTSLAADEDGTLYFKNDSGYVMALGSRVDSLKVEGKTVYKAGEKFDTDSLKVTAVLANGVEKDVTARAVYDLDEELTVEDDEISVSFDGMLYGDKDDEAGYEYDAVYGTLEITVLAEEDYEAVEACIEAIDAIGEVTLDSKDAIDNADALYSALSDELKALVTNADVLEQAKTDYEALLNADSSSEEDSSEEETSSEDESGNEDTSSDETSSEETSSAADSSSSSSASSSAASSSTAAAKTDTNPATGSAAAVSLGVLLIGAAVTVSRKSK